MTASIPFDTLTFSKRLVAAGCDQRLAGEQALAQAEIITQQAEHINYLVVNQLATKTDLGKVQEEIKRVEGKVDRLADDTKKDLKHLESTLFFKLAGFMTVLFGVGGGILKFFLKI